MNTPVNPSNTAAFYAQSVASFVLSLGATAIGVAYLPVDGWIRAFLILGLLYAITSTVTLAKCVRDRQEVTTVHSRVDQARMEKLLTEHDPFKTGSL